MNTYERHLTECDRCRACPFALCVKGAAAFRRELARPEQEEAPSASQKLRGGVAGQGPTSLSFGGTQSNPRKGIPPPKQ